MSDEAKDKVYKEEARLKISWSTHGGHERSRKIYCIKRKAVGGGYAKTKCRNNATGDRKRTDYFQFKDFYPVTF
jgi:hypothetical protein